MGVYVTCSSQCEKDKTGIVTYNVYSKIVPYRHIGTCEYELLYYVDMYKVYIVNYTRDYCMCT